MNPLPADYQDFLSQREIPREAEVPPLSTEEIAQITEAVFTKTDLRRSDVMFVFGSSDGDWPAVAKLFSQGWAKIILVNGKLGRDYFAQGKPIARLIQGELVTLGVPAEAMFIQDQSTNTWEDVKFGKETLEHQGIQPKKILFVSKAHHGGRALRTLKKFFPHTRLFPFTYDAIYEDVAVSRTNWWHHPTARARVYGEYVRIQRYAARGDIEM